MHPADTGTIQFRSSDDWWQDDAVTAALREAEDNRPPQRPLIDDGKTMNRFLAWCEQRQGLDRSLTQMQREHDEGRIGEVPVRVAS